MSNHWLATYEWRRCTQGSEWRRENVLVTGDIGVWWAQYLTKVKEIEDEDCAKIEDYEERGVPVPFMNKMEIAEYRFLYATPITDEGWEALHDKPIGDVEDVRG